LRIQGYVYLNKHLKNNIVVNYKFKCLTAKTQTVTALTGNVIAACKDSTGSYAEFNVYVTDQDNNRTGKNTPGGIATPLAGNRVKGFADAAGANAAFNVPVRIAAKSTSKVRS
jgi:hypothetical protein